MPLAAQGELGITGAFRSPGYFAIICISYQGALSHHHGLVLSQRGCEVPGLIFFTPGFGPCLPCACVVNSSQNPCSLLCAFTSPAWARWAFRGSFQPAPGAPALAQVPPACGSSPCPWGHPLIPEHQKLARGTVLPCFGPPWDSSTEGHIAMVK